MVITLTPRDLIERCLWDKYERHILTKMPQSEKDEIIRENKPFSISERDAYIIGLLGVIYTDNLPHKFNEYLRSVLDAKSFEQSAVSPTSDDELEELLPNKRIVNVDIVLDSIDRFLKMFPKAWEPNDAWASSIDEVSEYIAELKPKIRKIVTINVQDTPHVPVAVVRKLMKPQYR